MSPSDSWCGRCCHRRPVRGLHGARRVSALTPEFSCILSNLIFIASWVRPDADNLFPLWGPMENKEDITPTEAIPPEVSTSKPKLRKPVKPDVEEHRAAVDQLQNEMQKRRARIDEIKQTIDQKRNFDSGPEFQQARSKLNQLSSSFKEQLVPFSNCPGILHDSIDAIPQSLFAAKKAKSALCKPFLGNATPLM